MEKNESNASQIKCMPKLTSVALKLSCYEALFTWEVH